MELDYWDNIQQLNGILLLRVWGIILFIQVWGVWDTRVWLNHILGKKGFINWTSRAKGLTKLPCIPEIIVTLYSNHPQALTAQATKFGAVGYSYIMRDVSDLQSCMKQLRGSDYKSDWAWCNQFISHGLLWLCIILQHGCYGVSLV